MLKKTLSLSLVALAVMLLSSQAQARLFLSDDRLDELQALVKKKGSHEQAAFAVMEKRVASKDIEAAYISGGGKYETSWRAREAALLSLLATDPKKAKGYADLAYEMCVKASGGAIDRSHNQTGKVVRMDTGYGLARAMIGMNVAITYNWLKDSWSDEQNKVVKGALIQAINAWPSYGHANFGLARASNWVAVCRGAELTMILCTDEQGKRADRVSFLKKQLSWHMTNAFGDHGVCQEGLGYTEYPGQFLLAACYALSESGDKSLLKQAEKIGWWKLVMYAYTFQPRTAEAGDRKFLQWGVAVRGPDEGWVSLLLNLVPKDQLPYYLWWYDRFAGRQANIEGDHAAFDAHRAGTTWSLIYYPTSVKAKDPTGVFPGSIKDSHGFAVFRNRWQDENDIQVLAASDDVHHRRAWDKADMHGIRLFGHNAAIFNGTGKSGKNPDYSTLLINGKFGEKGNHKYTGKAKYFKASDNGGYFIADGGAFYKKLGVDSAERHTMVEFTSTKDNTAIISTLDKIQSGKENSYTWQGNLGATGVTDTSKVTNSKEAGRPTFLIRTGNGYVKGWVMHPADATIKTGDPLQITTKGSNTDIWIVMHTGSGKAPAAKISGDGLKSVIRIDGKTLRLDSKASKIVAK